MKRSIMPKVQTSKHRHMLKCVHFIRHFEERLSPQHAMPSSACIDQGSKFAITSSIHTASSSKQLLNRLRAGIGRFSFPSNQ